MELKNLKKINGLRQRGNAARDAVDPGIFAKSLAKLEEVDVHFATFTQIKALFTEMSRDTRVKKIRLVGHNLSQMAPELFAGVLSKLKDVTLINNKTTKEQMETLFSKISDQSFLKRLELRVESVESVVHVERGLFARAMAKIEDITLCMWGNFYTRNQIVELVDTLELGTEVKKFSLIGYDFFDAGQFSRAMSRLVEVDLKDCRITGGQAQALFTEIPPTTQLKKLDLPLTNLSLLDPGLFSRVMGRMENVVFRFANRLTTAQVEAFFTEAASSTHLKTLELDAVDLSTLNHQVFSQVVVRLEEVKLCQAPLTQDQVQTLFTAMSTDTKIKKLVIVWGNVSSLNPQVLATVLNGLGEVTFRNTGITRHQVEAFFAGMSGNTELKKLRFDHIDLSTLEPEVLGPALNKVKDVGLVDCGLNREHFTAILTRVLEDDSKLRKLWLGGIDAANVNPEIVGKVQDKLRGELKGRYH